MKVQSAACFGTAVLMFGILSVSGRSLFAQDESATEVAQGETSTGGDSPSSDQSVEPAMERTLPAIGDPLTEEERELIVSDDYVSPSDIAAKAFAPPPGAKPISKRNLWIDAKNQRVFVDGYVAMNDGPLEMFACPAGTKEHESIVATIAKSSEVHAALLAVGAQTGTTVRFLPRYVPATGQRIRVWICYQNDAGNFKVVDGRQWVQVAETEKTMDVDWVFAGSGFWKDPTDNHEYYRADSGDMICVSNFSTAMMDVPVASSADASELEYSPMTANIPKRGTPVRMVLMPIPLATDANQGNAPEIQKPTEEVLPLNKQQ
ncbi:hypothetical protein Poly51_44930 [Rubripirellula tenax]|uniref:Uncharacterized protein n=1 Tax=Rubripirellula tenax TaxID=2528015 RepID=A0A5C6EFN3_9BACT|nr:YdjY domain-containing protein [Rubripirellula tenax]TWU48593.1 hypothetical protein Poly51_44930 [Rubripirellula tenax]